MEINWKYCINPSVSEIFCFPWSSRESLRQLEEEFGTVGENDLFISLLRNLASFSWSERFARCDKRENGGTIRQISTKRPSSWRLTVGWGILVDFYRSSAPFL